MVEGEKKRARRNLTVEWELVRKVLNLLGIVLEFLSFWFAAPEILGEERLRAIERRVEQGIRASPVLLFAVAVMLYVVFVGWAMWAGMVGAVPLATFWAALGALVGAAVILFLQGVAEKIAPPLLRILADDTRRRQRSLAVGAVLFVFAFLCQCTAAVLDVIGVMS